MRHIRKIATVMACCFAFALFLPQFADADTGAYIIHESSSTQNIAAGVTLESITRFTIDGWLNINVLRVDLSNKYIALDSISSPESIAKLMPVKALAENSGAVAAINASFFNPTGNGHGYPDGTIVQNGEVKSAYSEYNKYGDVMASFSLSKLGQVFYDYWKTEIALIGPKGFTLPVKQYNKPSRLEYTDLTILDRKWSSVSVGSSEKYPDIVEMVVEDGKVREIREGQPAAAIPENGYVVVTRKEGGALLSQNFKVGSPVDMDIKTSPNDWKDINMSVTGSSILVKDGKIPDKFSFNGSDILKKQPRTAIGSSKNGKELYLVTVDGRQNGSMGMTQEELASFMLSLGAHNALNLDGGGSTTMVARTLGTNNINIVNRPSGETARIVSTAIGVFSLAPKSSLAGLIIDTEDTNVFTGTSRAFTVRGYDKYFNPVEIVPEQVKWSVTGIKGEFKGNVFYPQSVGEGKITASIGDVKGTLSISSLSSPVQLTLSQKLAKASIGQSFQLSVSGINKNGYSAIINPQDVKWAVKGGIGLIDAGKFTATSMGTGYIDAWIGNVHSYCAVSVSGVSSSIKDGFETSNGSFLSYPDTVRGSYRRSSAKEHSGKYSGRLSYRFTDSEETQAAYIVFEDKGILLDASATKIGVWVYNNHPNSNWLRAEVVDSKGTKHLLTFAKAIDWTGWKFVEASLDGIQSPSAITRLYIAKVYPVADSGTIYFDDLTVTSTGYPEINMKDIPSDTMPEDEANKSVTYRESADSFRFAVFGQSREPGNSLEKQLVKKLVEKINKYIDVSAFVGKGGHEAAASIKKPAITTGTGYKSMDIKTSRLIQLDTSKQGLRASGKEQWHWFLSQLDSFSGSNVFIFMSDSPDLFSDSMEAKLFKETLTAYVKKTRRNVWVLYKGNSNASRMERGVKYISSAGFDVEGLSQANADAAKYLLVTVKGDTPSFEFKPID